METIHKLKDNAYKLIFGEPEISLEFLNSFIPIDILKKIKASDIEDITERFLPLFSDNRDSDTVKRYIKENDKRYYEEKENGITKLKLSTSKDFKLPPVLPIVFYDGNTKWTGSLNLVERTELSEIFSKYIPKFEYELVDLNRYSRDDLVRFGNLLSLILIVDKVRRAEDLDLLNTLPENYLEQLKLNVPEHLLKLLSDCIRLFLIKAEVEERNIDSITEKLYQRRFVDMFDVQFSIREIKEKERLEGRLEGVFEAATKIAKKLLEDGIPMDIISKATGLDTTILEALESENSTP